MRNKLKLQTLEERRKVNRLAMFYKCDSKQVSIDMPFTLSGENSRTTRATRAHSYSIPAHHKDCLKFSFFHRTALDWNSLDESVANSYSVHTFKTALTKSLSDNS